MKEILILSLSYCINSPQGIRMRNLVNFLKDKFNVTVLLIENENKNCENSDKISFISIKQKRLFKLFFNIEKLTNFNKIDKKYRQNKSYILSYIKKVITKILIPDYFILFYPSIKAKIIEIFTSKKYNIIIISAFPFTLMKLSKIIKKLTPSSIIIYDTGDPFYKNFQNGIIKNIFAKEYEKKYLKFIDYIIVPTDILRDHYINVFKINKEKIKTIEQGVSVRFQNIFERKSSINKESVNLIYAGLFYKKIREPYNLYKVIDKLAGKFTLDIYGTINRRFIKKSRFINFHSSVPQNNLYNLYKAADIIVFIDNKSGLHIPGKLYEILSLNRPVLFIYNKNSPSLTYVENKKNIILTRNNQRDIKENLLYIVENYASFGIDKINPEYTWEVIFKKYYDLLS
jgi:hypothetical protein